MIALSKTRPLVSKYNNKITYNDRKNNQLKENMIALGNVTSVLCVALIIILFAKVSFVAEVCMGHHGSIIQTITLWATHRFNQLNYLIKVTEKSFDDCERLLLRTVQPCKRKRINALSK